MRSIKTLIADDNQDAIEILHYFLKGSPYVEVVGTCKNGEELIEETILKKPDLILTDINMPHRNGIDAVKECLAFQPNLKFIFITGYEEFAIEAFNIAAIDYIVKPLEKERLWLALDKAKNILLFEKEKMENSAVWEEKIENLPIRTQNGVLFIPLDNIYFIEKIGKKCLIHTATMIQETSLPIGQLISKLNSSFFKCHRSFIINLDKVSNIKPLNESFMVEFLDYNRAAFVSKLKINEVRERIVMTK